MSPDAPTPPAEMTTDVPLLAGRYQVLEQLGQGGMGAVFRARDAKLERPVAIKKLPEGSAPDAGAVARFRREARALAKLSHPGIIQAYDSGEEGGRPFLVMELVEGHSLAAVLREQGRVAPARAADFAYQAALALCHAHQSGLVHRDVKPSNLLLSADGRVRLLDLGLARFLQDQIGEANLTRTGTGMGTPDYCPPEQFRDAHKADARSDVYSLGCTLYHLIAGRVPFPGSSFSEKVEAHETKEPAPLEEVCPEVPAGLALAVRRMMAKRPADRFQTMAEVAEALMPHVAGSSAAFPQIRKSATWDGSRLATMTAVPRRRRLVALAGAGAVVLLLAGVVGLAGFLAGWFRPDGSQVAENRATELAPAGAPPKGDAPATPADDPNVLTVSQEGKDGGKFRTISAALEAVKPGQTIRVLDSATYAEALALRSPTAQDNIILEAVARATIEVPAGGGVGIDLQGVAGVTVRGFRLRGSGGQTVLILAQHVGGGVLIEDLDLELPRRQLRAEDVLVGISVETHRVDAASPLVVRRCRFHGGRTAVQLADGGGDSSGVAIRENDFTDALRGVLIAGSWRRLAVVGNRFRQSLIGLQLEMLGGNTDDVLLANNTFFDDTYAIRVADSGTHGRVACRNNLILDRGKPDVVYYSWDGRSGAPNRPGDVAALGKNWQMSHNWREVAQPHGDSLDAKAWVPPGPKDVLKEQIDGVNSDPKSPDFLRPAKDSPLATEGAGKEDPSLPRYVGAVPPEGIEPWDWDRTWRMPAGAKLLTVSKGAKDGGQYRTIGEALAAAKPWATIRVLDQGEYEETIFIEGKDHEGVSLDALRGATLVGSLTGPVLTITSVPNVRVRGFGVRGHARVRPGTPLLVVTGVATGVVLERLELQSPTPARLMGITLQDVKAAPGQAPLTVRHCTIRVGYDGIRVVGRPESMKGPTCFGIRVENNWVSSLRGIWIGGAVARIQVAGNAIWDCDQSGLQVENLSPESGSIFLVNNTVRRCHYPLRVWQEAKGDPVAAGQVEVRNNLFLEASGADIAFQVGIVRETEAVPGDPGELARLWRFAHNGRDLSGVGDSLRVPLQSSDIYLGTGPFPKADAGSPDRWRPPKDSPLAAKGAGTVDASLPAYVGALPPQEGSPWDWDRTWRTRMKATEEKK